MRTLIMTLCSTTALLLAPHAAQAGIEWSYLGDTEIQISSGGSTLFFKGTAGGAGGNTGVVLYNITASSTTANDGTPDHFDNAPFTLNVSIIDELTRSAKDDSNQIQTLQFTGFFTGDMTKGSLNNWSVSWLKDEESALLGNSTVGTRKYDVKIDGFLPPSPNSPTSNGFGAIHANVITTTVTEPGIETPPVDPPAPNETPEPTSLVLAGLALTGIGASRWRRRGRKGR